MKQLLVLSGKGGTGKTTVAGAFAALASKKVLADCDVDAADLHLLLAPEVVETHDFKALPKAEIDSVKCTGCGTCAAVCRFAAPAAQPDGRYRIDPFLCEGCRACVSACPGGAIYLSERVAGEWFLSRTRFGPFVHARLKPGEENSGKLVAQVRRAAAEVAAEEGCDLIIIDGPPGIGCPVISALSGVDLVLVVTEPSAAGRHDLERVVKLACHFAVPVLAAVNKWDLEPAGTEAIERYLRDEEIPPAGRIPFDPELVAAAAAGLPAVEGRRGEGARALMALWETVRRTLEI